jgi:hypothetical protein
MKRKHRDAYHFDDDEVEDGREVRVPLMMCDSRPRHWPGYATPLTDAEVADRLAFHQPGFRTADQASKSTNFVDLDAARDAARLARQEMIDRANSAWRTDARRKKPDDDEDDDEDEDALDRERNRRSDDRSTADARAEGYGRVRCVLREAPAGLEDAAQRRRKPWGPWSPRL